MEEIVKHINDTNASFRQPNAGDAKNTDLFLIMSIIFYLKIVENKLQSGIAKKI